MNFIVRRVVPDSLAATVADLPCAIELKKELTRASIGGSTIIFPPDPILVLILLAVSHLKILARVVPEDRAAV